MKKLSAKLDKVMPNIFMLSAVIYIICILVTMVYGQDYQKILYYISLSSILVSIMAFLLSIIKYEDSLKESQNNILCQYNQRYSTDSNIKRVVSWMLRNMNDNGSLKVDGQRTTIGEPNLYQKEMFMRFFEEIKVQMDNGKLSGKDVKRLFSYYALKFNDYYFFRKGIVDYKSSDDYEDFRQFIINMGGKIPNDENI